MGNGNNSNTHTSVTYGDSLFGEKDRALMALSDNRNADSVPIYTASLPQEVMKTITSFTPPTSYFKMLIYDDNSDSVEHKPGARAFKHTTLNILIETVR